MYSRQLKISLNIAVIAVIAVRGGTVDLDHRSLRLNGTSYRSFRGSKLDIVTYH